MTSSDRVTKRQFRVRIDPRRRAFSMLLESITNALRGALVDEGMTVTELAQKIGRNKSFVSRKLSGGSNMTVETLADLAWALRRPYVEVTLIPESSNGRPAPTNMSVDVSTPTSRLISEPGFKVLS